MALPATNGHTPKLIPLKGRRRGNILSRFWQQFLNTPPRVKLIWLGGCLLLLSNVGLVWMVLHPPSEQVVQEQDLEQLKHDYLMSDLDPRALAGITPSTPQSEALALTKEHLPIFDIWMNQEITVVLNQLLAPEIKRLTDQARQEVADGVMDDTRDPVRDIALDSCADKMPAYKCVLLRYAADGIITFLHASAAGDVDAASEGINRYFAATLAVYPRPLPATVDTDVAARMLKDHRLVMYDLALFLPEFDPVSDQFILPAPNQRVLQEKE